MTKFTDEVEIDAPTQVGLVVTGPVAGVGAGAQLATTGTGGRGWEILATGQKSAQGQDKLNIRDLGNGTDVVTITSEGKVGIGTTLPFAALAINAPDANGLYISGPGAPGVGAGVSLAPAGRVGGGGGVLGSFLTSWQILATGQTASQGSDKLNFSYLVGDVGHFSSVDALTITSESGGGFSRVGIGTTNPGFKLEIDAPDQLGLHVTGPSTGVGAGVSLATVNAAANVNSWEILATGDTAAQGTGKLNIRNLITGGEDIFAIVKGAVDVNGTLNVSGAVDVNGALNVGGDIEVTGDVRLTGGDCAEDFDVSEAERVEPGSVMVIDEQGALMESRNAYDKKVAGVISGAGDYRPGIVLDKQLPADSRLPVALVGKVYCKVDAEVAPVEVGDLLTTSATPGHAMKACDSVRAFGAVIGKALRPLRSGRGLIPILVALQ